MAGSFTADISRFVERAGGNMDKAVRQTVVLAGQGVVLASPVDTGRFRSNWQFGADFPRGALDTFDKGGGATISKIATESAGTKAGGVVWLVNNLPYAGELEYGHSSQAPQGVMRITLLNLPHAIEEYCRGLN